MEQKPGISRVFTSSFERWIGPEGVFDYTYDAPTCDADELMGRMIARSDVDSLVKHRFSQTPLAPDKLIDMGLRYGDVVSNELEHRISKRADELELPDMFTDAIKLEVAMELSRRLQGNSRAAARLYNEIHGMEVSENDTELIWRARTGDATLAETGQLLLRYPGMQSIEAAKYTEPLSPNIDGNMRAHIMHGLSDFVRGISHPSKVSLHVYKPTDLRRNVHYMNVVQPEYDEYTASMLSCVMALKESVCEVSNGDVTIQLVNKHTNIMLPAELDLSNKLHYSNVRMVNGSQVNVLPNAISSYWRVKPTGDQSGS